MYLNITTAIDYVNSKPHIGHAYEKVLADTVVRWHRLNKRNVRFLTGTDENGQKNLEAATKENISVQQFVDRNAKQFVSLCGKLNIGYNRFIRTTEPVHQKICQDVFKKLYDKADIYKGLYEGRYCVGCESFLSDREIVDGRCPEHQMVPQIIKEECYYFRISNHQKAIIEFVKERVFPQSRANEMLSRLEEPLRDICVSRRGEWGIPFNEDFKIYVWFDALMNYISGLCHPGIHLIGKGINWFHSVVWPGILLSLGEPLPEKIVVHGYLT